MQENVVVTEPSVFYRDLAYVFGAAVVGGLGAKLLRQPLILGYVVGGILVGPFTPGPTVSDIHALELLAEIGVILLMYSIGIEFSPRDLLPAKWIAIGGGRWASCFPSRSASGPDGCWAGARRKALRLALS